MRFRDKVSVLGKAKTGFRFRFRKSLHCKSAGGGRGVEIKDGTDRTVCSAGNVLVTVACAANSLIDLMMGDLETFLKSLND